MGSDNFFSKLASIDPLAHVLHLPGANKYAQSELERANEAPDSGPYNGVAPTLAGANAGYTPGGPGANVDYHPWQIQRPGGIFGGLQRIATASGVSTPNPADRNFVSGTPQQQLSTVRSGTLPGAPGYTSPAPIAPNPYVTAISGAGPKPVSTNTIFNRNTQPTAWGQ